VPAQCTAVPFIAHVASTMRALPVRTNSSAEHVVCLWCSHTASFPSQPSSLVRLGAPSPLFTARRCRTWGVHCWVCNWSPCVRVWQQMEVDPLVRSMRVPDARHQRRVPAGAAPPRAGTPGDHPVAKTALSKVFCAKL
jgi:hypothetical protein